MMPFHHLFRFLRNTYYWFKFPTKLSTKELCDLAVAIALDKQKRIHKKAINNVAENPPLSSDGFESCILEELKAIRDELNDITSTNQ